MSSDYRGDYGHDPRPSSGGYAGGRRGPGPREPRERRGIPLSELDQTLTEFSRRVIGCSIEVHKALGPGYDKSTYLAALKKEMNANGLNYKPSHTFPVTYRDSKIADAVADLFVEDRFVVEVLARPGDVSTFDRLSVRAKLKAANLDLGLVINFAERRLKDGLVRVLNIDKINADRGITGESHHDQPPAHDSGSVHDFDTH